MSYAVLCFPMRAARPISLLLFQLYLV
jgi:hypothetical protein